jgi:hypothetical protein
MNYNKIILLSIADGEIISTNCNTDEVIKGKIKPPEIFYERYNYLAVCGLLLILFINLSIQNHENKNIIYNY